ncbi:coiled-coil domain-containing protein [Crocosphaera sp. Alani8]|uniref:coiled-coil domain-containing protein n=1 Tax=Crocosphaera sp. Alani8 TaxID=3038952 RepID=UPI00313D64D0
MLLKLSLDHGLDKARAFQQELSLLTDEEKIAFFKNCGGEKIIQPYTSLLEWWESLTDDWQKKLLNAPFQFVKENFWFELSNLSFQELRQWYEGIIERSEKSSKNNGKKTLSPNIWKKVASEIRPQKQVKRSLKLEQTVKEQDFNVLLNHGFTPESLQQLKLEVFAGVNGQIVTRSLFPYLKARNFNPLLILSPGDRIRFEYDQKLEEKDKEGDRIRFEYDQKLEEKDKEIEELRSQFSELNEKLQQKDEQLEKQQKEIDQLKQESKEFKEFMKASKAAVAAVA